MMKRFFALCIFILSVIALRPELAFADTVPINGCLNASQHDWIVYGGNWTASGHGTCGRANINGAWIGSKPFTVTSGATLTFWATSDTGGCCGSVTPSVYNWDSATRNDLTAAGSLSGAFQSFTRDLSAYVGAHISIFFTGTSGAVSDISITNATNSYFGDPRKIGGAFGAGLSPFVADSYTSWVSTDGHNANGALQFNNQACCYTRVWSYPFTSQGETWSFWAKGGNNVTGNLYLADLTQGAYYIMLTYSGVQPASWSVQNFNLAGFSGHDVAWFWNVAVNNQGAYLVDDLCPSSGCSGSTPWVAPTPTPLFVTLLRALYSIIGR